MQYANYTVRSEDLSCKHSLKRKTEVQDGHHDFENETRSHHHLSQHQPRQGVQGAAQGQQPHLGQGTDGSHPGGVQRGEEWNIFASWRWV